MFQVIRHKEKVFQPDKKKKSELYLLYSIIPVFYHKGVKKRRIHFSAKTVLFHIQVLLVKKETSQWVETTLHLISNVQLRDQAMVVKNLWVRDHKVTSSRKWRCLDRFIGHSKVLKEKTRQKKKKTHKPAAASSSLVYDFKKICFFFKSSALCNKASATTTLKNIYLCSIHIV